MTPRVEPVPVSAIVWPFATTLSGWPGATLGHVIARPSCSSGLPGDSASAASPVAENESPMPSKLPAVALAAETVLARGDDPPEHPAVMPTLLNARARPGSDP